MSTCTMTIFGGLGWDDTKINVNVSNDDFQGLGIRLGLDGSFLKMRIEICVLFSISNLLGKTPMDYVTSHACYLCDVGNTWEFVL